MNTHSMGQLIVSFFRNYLVAQRNLSKNTIAAYSDCIRLLLYFCCQRLNKSIDHLTFEMIDVDLILDFLAYLETERNNAPQTRNARLAAIRTFFRFLATEEPTLIDVCERICSIQDKKIPHKIIPSLDDDELQALFNVIDRTSLNGARDYALFYMLYNTGARVTELVDLEIEDLRFETPAQVKLTGKGNKERLVPLWSETVEAINCYLQLRQQHNIDHQKLFLNSNQQPITRFGIRHIIKKYKKIAAKKCLSLKNKTVSPHTFRHTTAFHLLRSGNDINGVKDWLGHADINTASLYANIDIETKRKALQACKPPQNSNPKPEWLNPNILQFLENLSKTA